MQDGRKFSVHLTDSRIPQKIHPLIAEVHVIVSDQVDGLYIGVGGEETCLALLSRAINVLQQKVICCVLLYSSYTDLAMKGSSLPYASAVLYLLEIHLKGDKGLHDAGVHSIHCLCQDHCMQPAEKGTQQLTSLLPPDMFVVRYAKTHHAPGMPISNAMCLSSLPAQEACLTQERHSSKASLMSQNETQEMLSLLAGVAVA